MIGLGLTRRFLSLFVLLGSCGPHSHAIKPPGGHFIWKGNMKTNKCPLVNSCENCNDHLSVDHVAVTVVKKKANDQHQPVPACTGVSAGFRSIFLCLSRFRDAYRCARSSDWGDRVPILPSDDRNIHTDSEWYIWRIEQKQCGKRGCSKTSISVDLNPGLVFSVWLCCSSPSAD